MLLVAPASILAGILTLWRHPAAPVLALARRSSPATPAAS
jgi:hypothetical protein